MAKYSIILNIHNVLKDGTHPVVIRLQFGAKRKLVGIPGVSAYEEQWSSDDWVLPSHPKSKNFNKLIRAKDVQVEGLFDDLHKGRNNMTPEEIIDILAPVEKRVSFFDFVISYVEGYREKKKIKMAANLESKARVIWCFHNKVKDFPVIQTKEQRYSGKSVFRLVKGKDLSFTDIDDKFLKKLSLYMEVERENSSRTIFNVKNFMRVLFNQAIKAKVLPAESYPFNEHKLSMPESQKIGLDQNEVLLIEQTDINSKTDTWLHAKNAWLYSFCFGGMRISDVLKTRWDDFMNGRLYYVMGKNEKPVSIEIPDRAQKILNYYQQFKEENNGFVFPALKDANLKDPANVELKISNAIRTYDKWLKKLATEAKVSKPISLHIARHSFGNITGDQISPQLLQLIYRHSNITTTMNYQKNWINNDLVDNAVGSIVNF